MFENTESGLFTDDGVTMSDVEKFNENYEMSPTQPEDENKWALRDRLRSEVLWAAVIGCIMTVFSAFGVWEKIGITADGFREVVAAVGAVLAAFGVFNDPTERGRF